MSNGLVSIPVGVGELIDKLSILWVKANNVKNEEKLLNINREYSLLLEKSLIFLENSEIRLFYEELCRVNSKLWEIEDDIRVEEKNKSFGDKFIQLARSVYITNDERFRLKNKINEVSGSFIREIKDYEDYQ